MAAGEAAGRYRSTMSKSKDPSGLLISVIRTLSTSDDVEDRETEKGRLEEAYEKCDRDLDELIVQHYTELTTAIRTYQSITERITNSRNKIKQVKENLLSCKMLLHCKRDELRKLWIEGIEHKHVLNLLDEIENIKQVPQKLEQCMASKHYLNATDMLVSAVDSLEGALLQVEGLSDLRLELHSKKMNMHLVLIDELHRHLYIKSTNRVGQRNKEKGRISSLVKDASPVPLMDVTNLSTPRKFLETSQFSTPGSSSMREASLLEIKEDTELDPEENSTVFMGILIKGLAKLKKIPETVKAIQDRLEQELKQIVKRSTTQVADNGYQRGENLSQENQPRLLLELLELLFDKFNAVAAAHAVVLGHLQQTVASPCSQYDGDIKLYDMVDVWVKIQDVLQMLLTEYLDMKNTRTASEPSTQLSYASSGREFAAFFAKKKPQRPKNPLFKFESSSHAISMSAYLREQRRELYSRSGELQGTHQCLPMSLNYCPPNQAKSSMYHDWIKQAASCPGSKCAGCFLAGKSNSILTAAFPSMEARFYYAFVYVAVCFYNTSKNLLLLRSMPLPHLAEIGSPAQLFSGWDGQLDRHRRSALSLETRLKCCFISPQRWMVACR
ncbi:exocyst complex component 4 isoform X2 [Falco peregrinus]|uniref:exocyst complex component 4 isoform X2 n=1 Tax=Falco peregrinus TaxID=8954 RepID=UPI00247B28CB|nr:exocyst complex component 4 isoform X2 [Falco peregrinus]